MTKKSPEEIADNILSNTSHEKHLYSHQEFEVRMRYKGLQQLKMNIIEAIEQERLEIKKLQEQIKKLKDRLDNSPAFVWERG